MPPSLTEAVASSTVSLLRTVSYILLFRVESRTPCRRKSRYFFCRRTEKHQHSMDTVGLVQEPLVKTDWFLTVTFKRICGVYQFSLTLTFLLGQNEIHERSRPAALVENRLPACLRKGRTNLFHLIKMPTSG